MKHFKSFLKRILPGFIINFWKSITNKSGIFRRFQKFGYHILPVSYYSPVPNTTELIENRHRWEKETDLSFINYNKEEELHLSNFFFRYQEELQSLPSFSYLQSLGFGPGYGEIEAHLLYCFVRYLHPKNVIEVGSGVSTFFTNSALSVNQKEGKVSNLICIEPYPYQALHNIHVREIIEKKVQDVSIDFFQRIDNDDILFIDSSHAVKIGSDVNFLILEVLPSLKKGAIIHIHDIPFPLLYPYPESWIFEQNIFWQEAVLLKSFLLYNNFFEIIYCSSYLHFKDPGILKRTFPQYDSTKHFPSSIWLRKIK